MSRRQLIRSSLIVLVSRLIMDITFGFIGVPLVAPRSLYNYLHVPSHRSSYGTDFGAVIASWTLPPRSES